MDYQYRQLQQKEIDGALSMVQRIFLTYVAPEYQSQGVEEFLKYIRPDAIQKLVAANKLVLYGCLDGSAIVGLLAFAPPTHISLLFVESGYHRRGIAKNLFALARQQWSGAKKITVHSSRYARPVYERLGFRATGRECAQNGIKYIPMEYSTS